MSEAPNSIEINSRKDALWYYSSLLGLKERRYPRKEEMPYSIFLPPEALGDFKSNILLTSQDGLERSQFVDWDFLKHQPRKTQVSLGNTENTGEDDSRQSALRAYLGRKALFAGHSHPEGRGVTETWMFSPSDIAGVFSYPRLAYITGVGAIPGASFLFQSEGSQRLSLLSGNVYEEVETKIRQDFDQKNVAKYLADKNVLLYVWDPGHNGFSENMIGKGMWLSKVSY